MQRGAVLANELKHNACKLSKWTVQALLAGSDILKFGYITRLNMKDSSRHVILGTQQFKPTEFAAQINLSLDNCWGIVRCIIDQVMAQKDGKYLIVKDPNKHVIRLYDIPDSTFESDDDEEEDDDVEGKFTVFIIFRFWGAFSSYIFCDWGLHVFTWQILLFCVVVCRVFNSTFPLSFLTDDALETPLKA